MAALVVLALLVGACRWIDLDVSSPIDNLINIGAAPVASIPFCGNVTSPRRLTCPGTPTAPPPSQTTPPPTSGPAPPCPDYFRYIHDDLRPWRGAGITRASVERARRHANFRLVVVGGRAYVEKYRRAHQTRDVFTQWGIPAAAPPLPRPRSRPGHHVRLRRPPRVHAADFPAPAEAPPVFLYCNDASTLDIVFPGWGWPEKNIRPWSQMLEEMRRESERVQWPERQPYAYWKGKLHVYRIRHELRRCNVSNDQEWNARLFTQDWKHAIRNGFKGSSIPKQCLYRYKIYIEGNAWSVSEKYILACDSPVLFVVTPFKDNLSRGLVAGKHYCPINRDHMYYMLHLLTEYAKLLRYKPTVPKKVVEICSESIVCPTRGLHRECMMDSMESHFTGFSPRTLPPPFTKEEPKEIADREAEVLRNIENIERLAS
ncbi:LOW QUALITY PROTEIN: hypothetical protein SETIT_4G071100v2 [Setaria italica]|uniref:Glycosyl transferase CAP10 domain-containing protein n=1 Tax=Setaria italica TaxID=4555 RepID=A0A368QS64_SETIT|nr:LOW QUALITY PROTEIN: hypothetical protein SETIT_4G071100v2 [Setaria italica]